MALHRLRQRADFVDMRYAYDSDRSLHSASDESERSSYHQSHSNSDRSYQTQPTEYSSSSVKRPSIHHHETCAGRLEKSPQQYFADREPQASPRASVETYASTVPSEEALAEEDEDVPEYELPEYTVTPYEGSVVASTPSDFSELFPSHRKLLILHDDTTPDGNMNLRLDTEVNFGGRKRLMTLFHLRLHDLKRREFSLRRYCRDSGREVCHSVRKHQKAATGMRPSFQRSLSNALNSMLPKSDVRPSTSANLKRNDSGYGSMHSMDPDDASRSHAADQLSKVQQHMTHTTKLEFSNYAQVDVRRTGVKAGKRYEFEYWGVSYAWKRITRQDSAVKETLFHLTSAGSEEVLAYIIPAPLSSSEARDEWSKGGWISPCSMWIADDRIVRSQKDLADVVVAAGLIALVDNSIRERFHSKAAKTRLEYVGPKRFLNEMFRRSSNHSNQSRPVSSSGTSRPSTSGGPGVTSSRMPAATVRQRSYGS